MNPLVAIQQSITAQLAKKPTAPDVASQFRVLVGAKRENQPTSTVAPDAPERGLTASEEKPNNEPPVADNAPEAASTPVSQPLAETRGRKHGKRGVK